MLLVLTNVQGWCTCWFLSQYWIWKFRSYSCYHFRVSGNLSYHPCPPPPPLLPTPFSPFFSLMQRLLKKTVPFLKPKEQQLIIQKQSLLFYVTISHIIRLVHVLFRLNFRCLVSGVWTENGKRDTCSLLLWFMQFIFQVFTFSAVFCCHSILLREE